MEPSLVASSPQVFKSLYSHHSGSALMQDQPHSKPLKNLKNTLGPTQTHIHIWTLAGMLQVFSVLKVSFTHSQTKTGQRISSLQLTNSCAYVKNIGEDRNQSGVSFQSLTHENPWTLCMLHIAKLCRLWSEYELTENRGSTSTFFDSSGICFVPIWIWRWEWKKGR